MKQYLIVTVFQLAGRSKQEWEPIPKVAPFGEGEYQYYAGIAESHNGYNPTLPQLKVVEAWHKIEIKAQDDHDERVKNIKLALALRLEQAKSSGISEDMGVFRLRQDEKTIIFFSPKAIEFNRDVLAEYPRIPCAPPDETGECIQGFTKSISDAALDRWDAARACNLQGIQM
jgi:hypothetical protein